MKTYRTMWLQNRSYTRELIDEEEIPAPDLYRNLRELNFINRYTGGYAAARKGFNSLLKGFSTPATMLDVGFGGGDFMRYFDRWASKKGLQLSFYGVDLKPDCVQYAHTNLGSMKNVQLICDDYRNLQPELLDKVDILHCSLFLHHLTDEEIISLFSLACRHRCHIVANDLHRSILPYWSIKILTAVFSRSYLVKNDACLSVRRGFTRGELEQLLRRAGYQKFSVTWSWAFRYVIVAFP